MKTVYTDDWIPKNFKLIIFHKKRTYIYKPRVATFDKTTHQMTTSQRIRRMVHFQASARLNITPLLNPVLSYEFVIFFEMKLDFGSQRYQRLKRRPG